MIRQIDHIGIAVEDIEKQIPFYRDVLGLSFLGVESLPERGLKVAFFKIGEVNLELLQPTDPDSAVGVFIRKKGPGIHHIAFKTDAINEEIERIKRNNIRMIDEAPKPGAHNTHVAFIHPGDTFKVLIELVDHR